MKSVAFVTYKALNGIAPDDRVAAETLQQRGIQVQGVVWNDPAADWASYDAIVLRSCWDYAYCPSQFVSWLDRLEALGVCVLNPLPIIRWNHDKHYLRDLQERGVPIAPTFWCERNSRPRVSKVLADRGWPKAVVKPTISGTAMLTWIAETGDRDHHDAQLAQLLTQRDMMIQEYMPEIEQGEWSLAFFGGEYSHAAVKRAKAGDFRVQDEHGGSWSRAQPTAQVRSEAARILHCVSEDLLYARVDGILRGGQFVLMELELIEPMLYFGENTAAAEMFAEKLIERL